MRAEELTAVARVANATERALFGALANEGEVVVAEGVHSLRGEDANFSLGGEELLAVLGVPGPVHQEADAACDTRGGVLHADAEEHVNGHGGVDRERVDLAEVALGALVDVEARGRLAAGHEARGVRGARQAGDDANGAVSEERRVEQVDPLLVVGCERRGDGGAEGGEGERRQLHGEVRV